MHVALNTTVYGGELAQLADAVRAVAESGADAVICQDLAVAQLIGQIAPRLPRHGSTQMSVHTLQGALELKELGFTRVVLARELSLPEVEHITKNCGIETECFVHGALCMCVSGQCYMSAFLGGRSGNRGSCAGPCRLPFEANALPEGKPGRLHHLSLKDNSAIDKLDKLQALGVASAKIEGRLRTPEYVAAAVSACLAGREGRAYDRDLLKKIICIDGKTMRSNKRGAGKAAHIVSAWSKEDGFCLGQKAVEEKSNEIVVIPELLDKIQIKGQTVTIDAMGTQTAIAEKIKKKRADYVLALKRNQNSLYEDVQEYFSDEEFQKRIRASGNYKKTQEKAHGQVEIREYYQTEDIKWLSQKKNWKGLSSIVMEKKTIEKDGKRRIEYRYFISSLKADIEQISRAVRGHWSIESMHWHLDVTFREDANTTLDKMAAQNLNIIRKWSLSILKPAQMTRHKLSMRKKRFVVSMRPIQYLEELLEA